MQTNAKEVKFDLSMTAEYYRTVAARAKELNTTESGVFMRGIALLLVAVQAKREGKMFGIAEADRIIHTEITNL